MSWFKPNKLAFLARWWQRPLPALGGAIAAFSLAGCPVEERYLYTPPVAQAAAGTAAASGGNVALAGGAGRAGMSSQGGSAAPAVGGGSSGGMAVVVDGGALHGGGSAASVNGGSSPGSGGSLQNSAGSTLSSGGSSPNPPDPVADAGAAGADYGAGGCGDLDGDLVQDCTQTLVDNARFDRDVSAWQAEIGVAQKWDQRNARKHESSGALAVQNSTLGAGDGITLDGSRQCRPAVGNKDYLFAARALIPSGQGSASASISIWFFGADHCADYLLSTAATPMLSDTDAWLLLEGKATAPPATRSIYVRLVAAKPFKQSSVEALFDDVLVREQ
jgi:hypothetical protein